MNMDVFIEAFIEGMDFDCVVSWCATLGVEVNYPATDDEYPDWEDELRVGLAEAMAKIGVPQTSKPEQIGNIIPDVMQDIIARTEGNNGGNNV